MTAFHTIAIPHDDILTGRLTMDVFAADLWEVFKGRGPAEYRDPVQFSQKTYETEGLKSLLDIVQGRLQGQGGDPVIQIQTPFGGGKTHALIAMYHRAKEWGAKPVVVVGTAMGPSETLWGVVEEQLAGKKREFAGQVSPGRDALRKVLEKHQPALILMDEVLEYVTKAAGVRVEESNLAAQSIAFMQELTEVAGTLERVSLVVALPSSLLEHFDERAERLFQQLQRVAGRVEKIYTPVQEHEITSVIHRRLFSQIARKNMEKLIAGFMDYALRESLLPVGVEASEYRGRFEASYPFLPEVVEALYHRWGSFGTFQRTRGVLRLLGLVVHSLKDKSIPYITLGDFDLANQEIRRELLKHIGAEYDSVIASDITGADSGARKVNAALGKAYQGLNLGERVATSIFMYSFSGGVERGANLGEIKRTATTLENPSAVVAEGVEQLKGQLFYLQEQAGKYFFTNQPNLNRILLTRMENIGEAQIRGVERELLEGRIKGECFKVFIWPEDHSGIGDTPDLKLLLLSEKAEALMRTILEQKGSTPRVHRNTIFFLAPLESERPGLETLVRKYLAYQALDADKTLTLTADQQKEIKTNLKKIDGNLSDAIRRVYRQLFIPGREGLKEQDLGIPTYGEQKPLDEEVYERLRLDGEILERLVPLVIKERYLRDRDWVLTEQLYQAGLKTPGETRAVGRQIWEEGIAEGVRDGLFGLGELEAEQPICRYFKENASVALTGGEIIIRGQICETQKVPVPYPPSERVKETQPSSVSEGRTEAGGAATQGRSSLRLRVVVPRGKVAGLMGVMNLLQNRFERMQILLTAEDGMMSEQEYEDKIMEAFRQMGVEVDEE